MVRCVIDITYHLHIFIIVLLCWLQLFFITFLKVVAVAHISYFYRIQILSELINNCILLKIILRIYHYYLLYINIAQMTIYGSIIVSLKTVNFYFPLIFVCSPNLKLQSHELADQNKARSKKISSELWTTYKFEINLDNIFFKISLKRD